ncbi:UbiA family prenyltransferase [Ferrimonas balearica]|uniref:UbiA family prenyltransferase n=1 Tax=Ferrimonas balearica TaxID=44012 RepID=UPI001C990BEB|nr:UbiA family prenyltransferase [Ferrimonas balearica]MBY5991864.1 UbiA family prenyltransferase [Ferrimonas balearica]
MMAVPLKQQTPLCVDLDGTLLKSDLSFELLLVIIRTQPWNLVPLLTTLLQSGLAPFKQRLASSAQLDVTRLPYHLPVIHYLERQAQRRPLWLCTGSDQKIARQVADHLGCFAGVIASDGEVNCTGERKAEALVGRFGPGGFDYVGNERKDLAVWQAGRRALLVTRSRRFALWVTQRVKLQRIFWGKPLSFKHCVKAIRAHQWSKNLLILVPLLLGHQALPAGTLDRALLTLAAFCTLASATYIINDLMDLSADRLHHQKRNRPYASGQIPISTGLSLVPLLLGLTAGLALLLPPVIQGMLLLYGLATLAYTFYLKHLLLVDVFTLAGLYCLRVLTGMLLVGGAGSFWLMAFSLFFFLSLAMAKRVTEIIHTVRLQPRAERVRGYRTRDSQVLTAFGVGCAIVASLVITLYFNGEKVQTLYAWPALLWLICPLLLYWLTRVWLLTSRGELHEDPVLFALRDPTSLLLIGASAGLVVLAANGDLWFDWLR